MSKMKELSMVLDELVTCGETLISTANALKDILSDTASDEKPPAKASKKASAKCQPFRSLGRQDHPAAEPSAESHG